MNIESIPKFTGIVKFADLPLVGQCSGSRGDVARLIDMN
jgi:hypothetical protein